MQSRESDRDPLVILAGLVPNIVNATRGLDEAALRRREAPGKWSIMEVIQHLADTELVYGWRVRHILTADTPSIAAYDQDLWASQLLYNEASLDAAIDQLRALRLANLRLYRTLDESQLARCGIHAERGRESVEDLIRSLGRHDLQHLRQIERIKRGIGAS